MPLNDSEVCRVSVKATDSSSPYVVLRDGMKDHLKMRAQKTTLPLLMLHSRRWAILFAFAIISLFIYIVSPIGSFCSAGWRTYQDRERFVTDADGQNYHYDNNMPLIFVGGMPRSGTTLIRVLLDAHPDVRCGEETRIIPRLLSLKQQWTKNPVEMNRLLEGGITNDVIDRAVSSFILEVIVRHGEPAPRLCNKDPFTLRAATYLHQLFPKAKFILMIRDGRAVVHSIITRKVTITGYDLTSYRQCLRKWNQAMLSMYKQCHELGPEWCLPVYYEQLVLQPKPWLEKILTFLDVEWSDDVMHHDKLVNKPGGISLSMLERSTDQVIKPINIDALSKWVGAIPKDVVRDMAKIAPMLESLGYNPNANPPEYGKPDTFVLNNTFQIKQNEDEWREKESNVEHERQALREKMMKDKHEVRAEKDDPKGDD